MILKDGTPKEKYAKLAAAEAVPVELVRDGRYTSTRHWPSGVCIVSVLNQADPDEGR